MKDAEEATCNKAVQKARQLLEENAALALEHIGAHDVGNQDHVNNPKPNEFRIDLRSVVAMRCRAEAEPMDEHSYHAVLKEISPCAKARA